MKKVWMGCLAMIGVQAASAQQTQGKVTYERTMEMQIQVCRYERSDATTDTENKDR